MPRDNVALQAFNRGQISRLALARTDLPRVALSAEEQKNWMPRTLGSMMLRPGLRYVVGTYNDTLARHLPFIFGSTDTALLELTPGRMRVVIDDEVLTRGSVSTTITNGTFTSNVSGWTDADETGATSQWATGGYLSLAGTGYARAIRRQQITVGAADQNDEHALRIEIERGPVTLRVGSSAGDDDYITETDLGTGTHSLALTPTGDFHIEFSSHRAAPVLVDSVAVESSGAVEFTTPWATADLKFVRYAQSADVVFVACDGLQQRRIERRATRSWSIVLYQPANGPFRTENIGKTRLTPSALSGSITVTASRPLFRSGHEGALFRMVSVGQKVSATLTGADQWSDPIRVTGVTSGRVFGIAITGTWTASIRVQRSIGEPGNWTNVLGPYTGNTSTTYNDGLDNQVVYYRIGIDTGEYTSGTATATLTFSAGSIAGIVRITDVTNSTSATADVLDALGGTDATEVWSEGAWSAYRGWPSAVGLYEGRLWWAGLNNIWGSISDAYEGFDPDFEGDAGPISRSIGQGPVDVINWIVPAQRLLLGTEGAEWSARSSTLDEPLSPSLFNLKEASTQGSARVGAVKIDSKVVFLQRSGLRIYELDYDVSKADYAATDLTALAPEIGEPAITRIEVQRQPDTRIHCRRDDGTVAVLIFDPAENVLCWVIIETDGDIEDITVLPGTDEDDVYYTVKRTIAGVDKRYLEKWAKESECRGPTEARLADSHVVYSGSATTTITGLSHLEDETVVVWGWNTSSPFTVTMPDGTTKSVGKDLGTYTVSGGQITGLSASVTDACVGLAYTARFKSTKLAYAAGLGAALNQRKRVSKLGLVLADAHAQGLQYGPDFDTLDDLPGTELSADIDENTIWEEYDYDMIEFPGEWDTDSRLCLKAAAPRPCTVLAAVVGMATNDTA